MFGPLLGNPNIERTLLFLFVNGKAYGAQLSRLFDAPLTPFQKALARLEQSGLILSEYEGKTRLYRFNTSYPLYQELEALLQKAYTLLPSEEKRPYTLSEAPRTSRDPHARLKTLLTLWEKLASVRRLTFTARSKTNHQGGGGWTGRGEGEVSVTKEGQSVLLFQESGHWKDRENMSFSNAYRWTFDRPAGVISLEHLRRGLDHPVFLFHLAPTSSRSLSSVDSHLCGGDTYFGKIYFDPHTLHFNWRVIGPKKNEDMDYFYS